ncbi:PepSY domain-containing protein [Fuerstiella marisgermanici]|uniref:Putative iron-regulated membrane protein n=1 Tax=Fuerstiella marisgermanici TaxID=1891926 RepID=A0A1P8WMS3_9PLAN|nr:PepSY domain-containing protein [Fuerstiella marisgermanici]APZ95337.1 putative iron-regulated membrane protein [Fuerstiella marisgermanici]
MSETNEQPSSPPRRLWSRFKILIRRIHLYSGLFLLPWVFLYGVTGAMFNHQGLFPSMAIQQIDQQVVADSAIKDFPTPAAFAQQVVDTLQQSAADAKITLAENHGAEFTNDVMFEVKEAGQQHVVYIDPIAQTAQVKTPPKNEEELQPLLSDIRNISLKPDPLDDARRSAAEIFSSVGIQSSDEPKPFAWTKLNFLADVDGELARVTYVLKDGHVDLTKHTGEDGMSPRNFLLRLHTSHGQPPHWNGRMFWSLAVDTMAIAMVCWGLTGLFMWWQLKRARILGTMVIACSLVTAAVMYFSIHDFYVATKL